MILRRTSRTYYILQAKPLLPWLSGLPFNTKFLMRVTIHDLLCMGAGHAECPVNKADWRSGQKWDIAELFFEEPVVFEPGTHFTYDNSATYMLSRIISSATGTNLDDYLYEKIFHPLDIPKPYWDRCPLGFPQGSRD
jgi:CubicO group peptidase (beta-lactamase class C family)